MVLHVSGMKRKTCDACHFGRQTNSVHPSRSEPRDCQAGQRFHSDVCFAACKSLGGNVCFVTLKDEASGYRLVEFLASKSDVAAALQRLLEAAERETGRKALSIRTDNGKEYVNEVVKNMLASRGVVHELSPAYVKQANGMAERENRTLCDMARSLLFNADLTTEERHLLWAEATATAAYLRNRVPTRGRKDVTPYELWFGKKPNIGHLRVFGSPAYVRIPDTKRKKFDPKSRKTVFVGYDRLTDRIIRTFDRDRKVIERVSDVEIEDGGIECRCVFIPWNDDEETAEIDVEETSPLETEEVSAADRTSSDDIFVDASEEIAESLEKTSPLVTKRGRPPGSKNQVKPPPVPHGMTLRNRDKETVLAAMAQALDPESVQDAMNRIDGDQWSKAMDEEIESLRKSETWSLVEMPENRNLVSSKWVFKAKTNADGTLARRKARLVARGFSQTHGVDYFETFAPVVRYESVRTVLALAAAKDMEVVQFDVKTAFLNGLLDEEVYMMQPEGYDDGSGRVCRLQRALYGLKQSSRVWNARFSEFLSTNGFVAAAEDGCVFIRKDGSDSIVICLYVDDGLVCGTRKQALAVFVQQLKAEFEVTVNDPNQYVGMEIARDRDAKTITVNQRGYISRVLERFGLTDAGTLVTPLDPAVKLSVDDSKEVIKCPYREAIGCLNYISLISRPDITYAVNALARYSEKPRAVHWNSAKRIMRYLKATIDFSITYGGKSANNELIGYCDSDWAGEVDQRRSTSGNVFLLNNGPVAWGSRLQKTSALSVAEAEYMSLTEALCECLWLRPLLASLGIEQTGPTPIYVDNRAAIALSRNPEFHKRTKHVGAKYHRVRQEQLNGIVTVNYVPTDDNVSDMMTKAVTSKTLERNLRLANIR